MKEMSITELIHHGKQFTDGNSIRVVIVKDHNGKPTKPPYQITKEVLEEYKNTPFSSPEYMTFDLTNWLEDKIK